MHHDVGRLETAIPRLEKAISSSFAPSMFSPQRTFQCTIPQTHAPIVRKDNPYGELRPTSSLCLGVEGVEIRVIEERIGKSRDKLIENSFYKTVFTSITNS
jgi:hypothetical protein